MATTLTLSQDCQADVFTLRRDAFRAGGSDEDVNTRQCPLVLLATVMYLSSIDSTSGVAASWHDEGRWLCGAVGSGYSKNSDQCIYFCWTLVSSRMLDMLYLSARRGAAMAGI